MGIAESLIRCRWGIEDCDDLIGDFRQALGCLIGALAIPQLRQQRDSMTVRARPIATQVAAHGCAVDDARRCADMPCDDMAIRTRADACDRVCQRADDRTRSAASTVAGVTVVDGLGFGLLASFPCFQCAGRNDLFALRSSCARNCVGYSGLRTFARNSWYPTSSVQSVSPYINGMHVHRSAASGPARAWHTAQQSGPNQKIAIAMHQEA